MTSLREHPDQSVLVHVARSDHEPVRLPGALLGVRSLDDVRTPVGGPVRWTGTTSLRASCG